MLDNQDMLRIGAPIENGEIFEVICWMGGFKPLRLDGFEVIFYQTPSNMVKPSLCKLIHDFEDHPGRIRYWKRYFLQQRNDNGSLRTVLIYKAIAIL